MGTAFVAFYVDEWKDSGRNQSKDITIEIGKAVFRSIIEEMELEKPGDDQWKSYLDGAYGIKWLFVGKDDRIQSTYDDVGPSFYWALQRLKVKGPPDFYPQSDLELFYDQIDQLEKQYSNLRPLPENANLPT